MCKNDSGLNLIKWFNLLNIYIDIWQTSRSCQCQRVQLAAFRKCIIHTFVVSSSSAQEITSQVVNSVESLSGLHMLAESVEGL